MLENVTRLKSRRLPGEFIKWLKQTLVNDYGWNPNGSPDYQKVFNLSGIVSDLMQEAANSSRFAYCADVIIARSADPGAIAYRLVNRATATKRYQRQISKYVYVRLTAEFKLICIYVEINSKHLVNIENKHGRISRTFYGDVEEALSYRDRVLLALDGPNPLDALNVPLFAS